jgi:hypothetical protein
MSLNSTELKHQHPRELRLDRTDRQAAFDHNGAGIYPAEAGQRIIDFIQRENCIPEPKGRDRGSTLGPRALT